MNYTECICHIAKSELQGKVLAELLDTVTADNQLIITNQAQLAKDLNVSRSTLKGILKRLSESKLAVKLETRIYQINPYIFIGKRTRSNELREQLQFEFKQRYPELV